MTVYSEEQIELLKQIAPGETDDRIRAALRKHGNNLDAAVMALLDGSDLTTSQERSFIGPLRPGDDPMQEDEQFTRGRGALNSGDNKRNNSPVPTIDLTGASPEIGAIGLAGSNFIDTSDKANWAVVHQPQASTPAVTYGPQLPPGHFQAHQDDELSKAISASLRDSMLDTGVSTPFVELSLQERIRPTPDYPVSVRTKNSQFLHIPPLLHALYHVPQMRDAFRGFRAGRHIGQFVTVFAQAMALMEMGIQSDVVFDDLIPSNHVDVNADAPVDIKGLLENIFNSFADEIKKLPPPFTPDLLYSKISYPPSNSFGSRNGYPFDSDDTDMFAHMSVIPIAANVNSPDNDLLSNLHEMTWSRRLGHAAQVLVFAISQEEGPGAPSMSTSKGPPQKYPLKFPARIFVDPFLSKNADIAASQKDIRHEIEKFIHEYESQLSILSGGTNAAPLKNMRATIKYFEEIALDDGDEKRGQERKWALEKLKQALENVEKEIEDIKGRIKLGKEEIADVYNVTALRKEPYDLRSVIMMDGLYGRTHVYTYVKARDGKWYKTVEATVTEVSEENVLTDATGLHLGAGPFLLFYSKSALQPDDDLIIDSESPTQESTADPTLEPSKTSTAPSEVPLSDAQRSFTLRQDEFSKWDLGIRKQIREVNARFREVLENNNILNMQGRLWIETTKDGKEEVVEREWFEDTLQRMEFEEEEESVEYDDDAAAIEVGNDELEGEDEVIIPGSFKLRPTTTESFHKPSGSGGNWEKPFVSTQEFSTNQGSTLDFPWNKETDDDEPLDWGPKDDGKVKWDEATPEGAEALGWQTAKRKDSTAIEIVVEQTVETVETDRPPTQLGHHVEEEKDAQ